MEILKEEILLEGQGEIKKLKFSLSSMQMDVHYNLVNNQLNAI